MGLRRNNTSIRVRETRRKKISNKVITMLAIAVAVTMLLFCLSITLTVYFFVTKKKGKKIPGSHVMPSSTMTSCNFQPRNDYTATQSPPPSPPPPPPPSPGAPRQQIIPQARVVQECAVRVKNDYTESVMLNMENDYYSVYSQ
jgi:hypothetical protein